MGVFAWILNRKKGGDSRLDEWRRRWLVEVETSTRAGAAALTAALSAVGLPEEEIEIEREMLSGLDELVTLRTAVDAAGLPTIDTGHRIVGTDRCHFSAPSSMPDEPSQPSGRLILTSARAVFAGSGKATTLPWHAVAQVVQQERDVILVRHDRETFNRFRCNVFADALTAAFLARTLAAGSRRQRSV